MSQHRVTVTVGRDRFGKVERRAKVVREMYSDQINGGTGVNRKRSVRERLGSSDQQSSAGRPLVSKRPRLEDVGKWKHDLFEDKDVGIKHPTGSDLRSRLQRKNVTKGQTDGEAGSGGAVKDLREKLSGPLPPPQGGRETLFSQRRLASVVRGTTGKSSVINGRPGAAQSALQQKSSILSKPSVAPKAKPAEVEEGTIAGLLQSLGLSKYLITFQAEEVDMTALQHMRDEDLKELGIPMGPRKRFSWPLPVTLSEIILAIPADRGVLKHASLTVCTGRDLRSGPDESAFYGLGCIKLK